LLFKRFGGVYFSRGSQHSICEGKRKAKGRQEEDKRKTRGKEVNIGKRSFE
jgi:hypothetical protein